MKRLIIPTLRTFLLGVLILGALLFLPAGTLTYWQAWVFIAVFLGAANAIGVYLALHDPELLERRKKAGPAAEQSPAQKIIISFALLAWIALLVCSGLNHRFGWSPVPVALVVLGNALVVLGFLLDFVVLKVNRYGGSTVEVVAGQTVITTGPYAVIRHPMYAGVLVMTLGIPLALAFWWGLGVVVLITPVLMWRILDEEKLLERELPGYVDYEQKVRYRLVPYLW